jgi:hypothetical protein
MTTLKPATFRLDEEMLEALQDIKDQTGMNVAEQVTRALDMWIDLMGPPPWKSERERMMSDELVEKLNGTGEVTKEAGGTLGPRRYRLTVWQEIHRVKTMGNNVSRVEGLKSITGSIELKDDAEGFDLVGQPLVLQLEDGRRFPFFFSSSDGTIAARGQLA